MVSRRSFAAITAMMLVVCFLFLLPQQMKEENNPYYVNSYVQTSLQLTRENQWQQPEIPSEAELEELDFYGMLIGDPESAIGKAVSTWAELTKSRLVCFDNVTDGANFGGKAPSVVFLDPDYCSFHYEMKKLLAWNQQGTTLVFCKLPNLSDVNSIYRLRKLMGIRSVEEASVELDAIHLFSGFLLGGERIYERDSDKMDLECSAPWLKLTEATEVYMVGELSQEILPEQDYRYQLVPPLLWRCSRNGTNVFVVNGDYICENLGVGFLSAILAEDRPYYVYPVVNSQVFTVANFPSMADENLEQITSRYGQGQLALVRDLLWPSLESMSEVSKFPMSCFLTPQQDYQDEVWPDSSLIAYYLKLIKERNAEAGISLQHNDSISMEEKWQWDSAFLNDVEQPYRYCAAYVTGEELEEFREQGESTLASVSADSREAFFAYLGQNTLCQYVTENLLEFTYLSDLQLLSQQTAISYSNVLLDMQRVTWPEEEEAGWEVYYDQAVSTLQTYWKPFSKFDKLTISESDARIRDFLNMDYRQERRGDVIAIEIDHFNERSDFILRTHMEDVVDVDGGSFTKLEKDAWLICADTPRVEISLAVNSLYES